LTDEERGVHYAGLLRTEVEEQGPDSVLAFTMEPLPAEVDAHVGLVEEAYRRGLLIYSRRTHGGTIGDHFMVCPPLTVNDADLDEIVRLLTDSLDAFAAASGLPVNSTRQV
jgi:adenosylmethionine-8-amino-7-oxononanoate aminotransferase